MKRFFCILLCLLTLVAGASAKQFTVVIDAGHGGKDPGALGKRGREKDINLRVAKEFGRLVRENMNDVKVVFTRDDDVFVPLQDRSAIANRANGDLFVSIHVNASKTTAACGAETYTIGLAKSDANFDVAKHSFWVKTAEEMEDYLATGSFPIAEQATAEESKNLDKVIATPAEEKAVEEALGFVPETAPVATPVVEMPKEEPKPAETPKFKGFSF